MLCGVCLKPESTAEVNFAEGTQWCVCLHACAPIMNLGWHKQCVTSSVHSIRHFVCFLVSINTEISELNCNNEYHCGVRNLCYDEPYVGKRPCTLNSPLGHTASGKTSEATHM